MRKTNYFILTLLTISFLLSLISCSNLSNTTSDSNIIEEKPFPIAISAGSCHTLVLKSDGKLWAAGHNKVGQLGNSTDINMNFFYQTMEKNKFLDDVTAIAAGGYHNIIIREDGGVWVVGSNSDGQLGIASTNNQSKYVEIDDRNGNFKNAISIAAGEINSLILKKDGTVWITGNNHGQLGNGTTNSSNIFVQAKDNSGKPISNVIAMACGTLHSIVLKRDGTVWSCGNNESGLLGDGTTKNSNVFIQSKDYSDKPLSGVIAIAAGMEHSLALKSDGTVWAVGYNKYGELSTGDTNNRSTFAQSLDNSLKPITDAEAISAGWGHTIVLKKDGTVWTSGRNPYGQLGNSASGSNTFRTTLAQARDNNGYVKDVIAISAGGYFSLILKKDKTVWASGSNEDGQFGNRTTTNSMVFIKVYE